MTIELIHRRRAPVTPDELLQERHLELGRLVARMNAATIPQERAMLQRRLDGCYEDIELIEKSAHYVVGNAGTHPRALAL